MNTNPEDKTQHERAFAMLGKKKKKETELSSVQLPVVKLYRQVIRPQFPDSVLIVNSLSDMYFSGEVTSKKGRSISKNALIMEKAKKAGFEPAQPDIIIVQKVGPCAGIALELKKEDVKVYKQDGTLRKSDHLDSQNAYLDRLARQGFYTAFASGLDEALNHLENYFKINIL